MYVCTLTWRIFTTLLSRFGERISTMKSPLLAARRRILHLSVQGHSYLVFFLSFSCYSFSCQRNLCYKHTRSVILQRFYDISFYFRRSSAFVVSSSAASPSQRLRLQHQLKIIASCWDHLPKLRIIFICLCELII